MQNGLITVFKTFKIVTYFVETPLSASFVKTGRKS